jgi:RES domain-containing protein
LIHDPVLLDRLSAFDQIQFDDNVFRATRQSLDPLTPSTSGGRWAPKDSVPVLYTSCKRDGALAEICFHWAQFTPLPTKPAALHELRVTTKKSLRLLRGNLEALGIDWRLYGEVNYARTQEIGAAVAFLECDGLLAPSARWECENLMLFMDNHSVDDNALEVVKTEAIDWQDWARKQHIITMPDAIGE